jgi:predicted nucleotidyltransferase
MVTRFCGDDIRVRCGSILREVIALAKSTERLEAAYIFGSFVTAEAAPADIDLFLVMSRDFSSNQVVGRARLLFDRSQAAIVWGICIYWITARRDRIPFLETWQLRRSGGLLGIVEVDL